MQSQIMASDVSDNETTRLDDRICTGSFTSLVDCWEGEEEICKKFRVDLIDGFALRASAVLSDFVIEYVIIGASMAFLMSQHIGM